MMLMYITYIIALSFLLSLWTAILLIIFLRKYFRDKRASYKRDKERINVAFFHPYCHAAGGVERILWCAVRAVLLRYPKCKIIIYTGDKNVSPSAIVALVKQRFDIHIPNAVTFIYLNKRKWIEKNMYPVFTFMGQSFGSMLLGFEALFSYLPDVYIDSTGFSFTLPLFKFIGGCSTACYIHCPSITKEMMKPRSSRVSSNNSKHFILRELVSTAELIYFKIFARLYGMCGRFSDCTMVASSWVEEHVKAIWDQPEIYKVYPPCDTTRLKALSMAPDINETELIKIISLGQFREDKNHSLQLKIMYELRQIIEKNIWARIRLIFIGTCRNADDDKSVKMLVDLCKQLRLENNIEFIINVENSVLKDELQSAMIGLHAMHNEHFGMCVVDCMAAGQIMVAHRSGGPKADIIDEVESRRTGFLAYDAQDYASTIALILGLSPSVRKEIREAARKSVDRFSTEEFDKNFLQAISTLLSN